MAADKKAVGKTDVNKLVDGEYPIHSAVKRDDLRKLRELVEAGVDLEISEKLDGKEINRAFDGSLNPLHRASKMGLVKVVDFLLDNGAKINAAVGEALFRMPGFTGRTALTIAVEEGHVVVVEALLKKREGREPVKVNVRDSPDHPTPFHLACVDGNVEIVRMLMSYLMASTLKSEREILTNSYIYIPLIRTGGDALMMAVNRGHIAVVQELLAYNVFNLTALENAKKQAESKPDCGEMCSILTEEIDRLMFEGAGKQKAMSDNKEFEEDASAYVTKGGERPAPPPKKISAYGGHDFFAECTKSFEERHRGDVASKG